MDKWVIWSNEHTAFWRPNHRGYCSFIVDAGRYSFEEAFEICQGANYPSDDNGYPIEKNRIVLHEVMCPSPEMIAHLKQKREA